MNIREEMERRELETLNPAASFSSQSKAIAQKMLVVSGQHQIEESSSFPQMFVQDARSIFEVFHEEGCAAKIKGASVKLRIGQICLQPLMWRAGCPAPPVLSGIKGFGRNSNHGVKHASVIVFEIALDHKRLNKAAFCQGRFVFGQKYDRSIRKNMRNMRCSLYVETDTEDFASESIPVFVKPVDDLFVGVVFVRVFRSHFFPFLYRLPFRPDPAILSVRKYRRIKCLTCLQAVLFRTYCISQYSIISYICHLELPKFIHEPGLYSMNCRGCTS